MRSCLILRKICAKEGTFPLPFRGKWAENRSHNLGKALEEGFGHTDVWTLRHMDGKTEFFCEM